MKYFRSDTRWVKKGKIRYPLVMSSISADQNFVLNEILVKLFLCTIAIMENSNYMQYKYYSC